MNEVSCLMRSEGDEGKEDIACGCSRRIEEE